VIATPIVGRLLEEEEAQLGSAHEVNATGMNYQLQS
jgi:hypothetical protein